MTKKAISEAKLQQPTIKTPQALIHIKHGISLLQYKYWILLLKELKAQFDSGTPTDENGFRFVSMQSIADALGYLPNKAQMVHDLTGLVKEPIVCNLMEKDGEQAKYIAGFLSEAKVTSSRVAFKFPSMLEGVVRGLEEPKAIFHLLNWSIFNRFSGKYEAVIYKLCKDYVGIGQTPYMTVDDFREYMGLKPTEYLAFKDLNRNVIAIPCVRINESELSDISVEVELEKVKRLVVGLRFRIKRKKQTTIPFPELEPNPIFRFAKVHIESVTQNTYLALRAPQEIELCIERANEYAGKQEIAGKSVNYGGLYRKAIEEGWHVQHEEKKQKTEATKKAKEKAAIENMAKTRTEEADKAKQAAEIDAIIARFDALPDAERAAISTGYRETLTAGIVRDRFDKDGARAAMHRYAFAKFAGERM